MPCYALTSLFSLYTFLCFCNICEIMFSAGSLFLYITKQHRNTRAYSLDILIFFSCIVLLVFFFPSISLKKILLCQCVCLFLWHLFICFVSVSRYHISCTSGNIYIYIYYISFYFFIYYSTKEIGKIIQCRNAQMHKLFITTTTQQVTSMPHTPMKCLSCLHKTVYNMHTYCANHGNNRQKRHTIIESFQV